MGKLHNIRLKSDAFIAQYNVNIRLAILNAANKLIAMNKAQMMNHKDAEGKPLTNKQTGSTKLSPAYARMKGQTRPNLFLKGSFQNQMFMEVNENNLTWFIDSYDDKSGILTENYGLKIFGIKDTQRAKQLTGKEFEKLYRRMVLGR